MKINNFCKYNLNNVVIFKIKLNYRNSSTICKSNFIFFPLKRQRETI